MRHLEQKRRARYNRVIEQTRKGLSMVYVRSNEFIQTSLGPAICQLHIKVLEQFLRDAEMGMTVPPATLVNMVQMQVMERTLLK